MNQKQINDSTHANQMKAREVLKQSALLKYGKQQVVE